MAHYLEDMTREELLALCKRWERASSSVGICGSEYYMDPERVFERVRGRVQAQHTALMSFAKRAKKAEAELRTKGEQDNG